jgi:Domain of unknown function (DUF4157)
MNTSSQTLTKPTPKPSFTPVKSGILQRKCACGNSASLTGKCTECENKRLTLQRHSADRDGVSEVPPIVGEVLRSPGRPLESDTRAFMEPRFGHDFSQVRVHTDGKAAESAQSVNALAYTVGQDVVFGVGQYQPHNLIGRALLAHELAHTIQQKTTNSNAIGEDVALENAANQAAFSVALNRSTKVAPATTAPAIQFLKVTPGGFGRALEEYTNLWKVPDKAIRLLQRSPTFMKLATVLDQNYVWRDDSSKVSPIQERDPSGRIKDGPFRGKRELLFTSCKPSFETFESPDNILSGDVICLESRDIPGFIQELAHEATHAARFVGATAPLPATIVDEAKAGIQDEIEARKSEAKILGEIPSKAVNDRVATVGSRVPAEVERDISPAFNLTYLELFFFGRRLREAQATDKLTDEEAQKIREQIDAKPQQTPFIFRPRPAPSGFYNLSEYADIWFNRLTAKREWEEFNKKHNSGDADFAVEKEKLLQDHAKRFFEGRLSYQSLPTP